MLDEGLDNLGTVTDGIVVSQGKIPEHFHSNERCKYSLEIYLCNSINWTIKYFTVQLQNLWMCRLHQFSQRQLF